MFWKRLVIALALTLTLGLGPVLAQEFWGCRPGCWQEVYVINGQQVLCKVCCAFGRLTRDCHPA